MKNTRKDFQKFKARSRLSEKQRAKRELLRAVEETNVAYGGARISASFDRGGRGRGSAERECIGKFCETSYGYGFVTPEDGGRDIFIPEGRSFCALDGDRVKISYRTYRTGLGEERTEGRVISVEEPYLERIIGTVRSDYYRHGRRLIRKLYLSPDNSRCHKEFFILGDPEVCEGDKALGKIVRHKSGYFECEIESSFGNSLSKEANYSAILAEYGIESSFTDIEIEEARVAASEKLTDEGRLNLTGEVIFTIDSESAKDLDDAVSLKKEGEGYALGVHIADVSHYVKEKTALDRLAMRRGNSVYFTDKVVPMLPESLSAGACSLLPGEDKYALSAIISLSKNGEIKGVTLEKTVIRSRVKGIYSEINEIFARTAPEALLKKYEECLPTLELMYSLYKILAKRSEARGALELDSDEAEIILDEQGAPVDVIRRVRGDGERLIEQFMLTANEAVATLMRREGIPCIFRTHAKPPEDKLSDFITYAHNLGFDTSYISADKSSGKDLSRLLCEAKERGISEAVSYSLLRAMAKAEYSDIPTGHFGLGIDNYCHFTSPIRRLSDLVTHRIITKALIEGKAAEKYRGAAKRAAAAANEGEARAVGAERRIDSLYKTIYMSQRLGERFVGRVSSVTSFGLFVTLQNTCEGLIPISELGGVYVFDEKNLTIRGGKDIFRVGDELTVSPVEADITRGKIRFELIR